MTIRIGSLCSGAGMLDSALECLFGANTAWQAELDDAASRVLVRHWPDVPNLGDVAAVDWPTIQPVDVLGAGFPCQPFSNAGKQGGAGDERHLWPTGVLPAVEALMPAVAVLENVPGLLTVGRGAVFARILADLDMLGYSTAWTTVGACRVGACHHRHRLFVLAVRSDAVAVPPAEPVASRHGGAWAPVQDVLFGDVEAVRWPASGVSRAGLVWPLPVETCGADRGDLPRELRSWDEAPPSWQPLPTPTARDASRGSGWGERPGRPLSEVAALLPTPRSSDANKGGPNQRGSSGDLMLPSRFGRYAAAVRQQELVFGFAAPDPTEPGRLGRPRLTASFCEWMMGLRSGWITDVVPRGDVIRIAGNGVVGQQVMLALPTLPTWPTALRLLAADTP